MKGRGTPVVTGHDGRNAQSGAPYYVKALALGLPGYLIGVHLQAWVLLASFYLGGHSDFRQIYATAQMVRAGESGHLYDPVAQERAQNKFVGVDRIIPFIRPAYELLLFLPLTFLSYRPAYFVMLATNLVLLFFVYRLLRPKMENLSAIHRWLPAAMHLAFLPIGIAMIEGQDSVLLLLLFAAALACLDQGRETLAGVLAGLGMFKFQLTIPLALVFLLWRRWDFIKGMLLSAVPAAVLSIWMVGYAQIHYYIRWLLLMAQPSPRMDVYPLMTINRMMNLHGLVFGILGAHVSPRWIAAITIVASAVVILRLAKIRPCGPDAFLYALLASAVLSYYLFFHDSSSLFIPIVIALDRFVATEGSTDRRGKIIFRLAGLLFVFPLLISYIPKYLSLATLPLLGLLFCWQSYGKPGFGRTTSVLPSSR
jgi:Glycosyltransferase family 87